MENLTTFQIWVFGILALAAGALIIIVVMVYSQGLMRKQILANQQEEKPDLDDALEHLIKMFERTVTDWEKFTTVAYDALHFQEAMKLGPEFLDRIYVLYAKKMREAGNKPCSYIGFYDGD